MRPRVRIPQTLEPEIYKNQTILLSYTNKYVMGFFDSSLNIKAGTFSEENIGNYLVLVEANGQRLMNCCQGMLALMRKGKNFVLPGSPKEHPLTKKDKKKEQIRYIRMIIDKTLENRVFSHLDEIIKDCSPFVFSHFWNICHILLNLSRQLGYSKGGYVARFLQSLHLSLKLNDQSNSQTNIDSIDYSGFADIINYLELYFRGRNLG